MLLQYDIPRDGGYPELRERSSYEVDELVDRLAVLPEATLGAGDWNPPYGATITVLEANFILHATFQADGVAIELFGSYETWEPWDSWKHSKPAPDSLSGLVDAPCLKTILRLLAERKSPGPFIRANARSWTDERREA
jgi:hypothetical protein